MLINVYHLRDLAGVEYEESNRYLKAMTRKIPPVTKGVDIDYCYRNKNVQGRFSVYHFDLEYSIDVAKETIAKKHFKTDVELWEGLLMALYKLKLVLKERGIPFKG